jgi:ankyrin repeat protein
MLAAENGCLEIAKLLLERGATLDAGKETNQRTALMLAAEQGHADVVTHLLLRGADVGARTKRGDTPLILALRGSLFPKGGEGNLHDTVAALLKHGSDVNVRGEYGRTPLMWAVRHVDAALVWSLLQKGADTTARDDQGQTAVTMAEEIKLDYLTSLLKNPRRSNLAILGAATPLSDAIKAGKTAEVASLIEKGADVNARFGNGSTPLMQAADIGRLDMAHLLISKGAEVNSKNGADFTPLMYAVAAGHDRIVQLLLARGADVHGTSLERTPLVLAVMNNRVETTRLLLHNGADPNAECDGAQLVTKAIQGGNQTITGLLIAGGAKVNAFDDMGKTPLMHAAEKGDMRTVRALVGKGASLNLQSKNSETALTLAIAGKHDDVVRFLMAKRAGMRSEDLQAAIHTGNLTLISGLLERGVDAGDSLLTALPKGGLNLVKLLVRKGADPNARDYYRKSPLILEAENWADAEPSVLDYLLDHGADIHAVDDKGMSALLYAAARGNHAVANVLIARGADTSLKNNEGKSAWTLAAEASDHKMMELLEKSGARREFAGMTWEGKNAALNESFIKVVVDRSEWEKLWLQAFNKPAPVVDFENFAVACVFLGGRADWLYSIEFGKPFVKDSIMHITYHLMMLRLRMAPGYDGHSFGGQYAMRVFARQQGVTYQVHRGKSEGDPDRFSPLFPERHPGDALR